MTPEQRATDYRWPACHWDGSIFTPDSYRPEYEADADIRDGRVRRFACGQSLIDHLRGSHDP